jgi:hypothetical protein
MRGGPRLVLAMMARIARRHLVEALDVLLREN